MCALLPCDASHDSTQTKTKSAVKLACGSLWTSDPTIQFEVDVFQMAPFRETKRAMYVFRCVANQSTATVHRFPNLRMFQHFVLHQKKQTLVTQARQ